MIYLISFSVFIAVLYFSLFLQGLSKSKSHQIEDRLAKRLRSSEKDKTKVTLERRENLSHVPVLDRLLRYIQPVRKIHIWIRQADLPFSTATFFLISAFNGILLFLWCYFLRIPFVISLLPVAFGALLPFAYVKFRRGQRMKIFSKGFPDAISRMGTSLRAGYSMQMAIESLVDEADSLIAKEFHLVLAEMEVGQNFETALQKMLERIDTPDLRLFIASVVIQRESGGNLADLLDNLEATIRDRFALQKELDSATGQAKLSGLVLSLLPVFVGFFVFLIHREYILFFFQDPVGSKLLWMSVMGQMTGMLTIRKIVSIQM